jgi:2-polyprenyl-3-methyl-5-hydroxy-6-metoxy-1,4-benzoquinol methylase
MSMSTEMRYRRRLYDAYFSSHFGVLHMVSPAGLDRDRRTWRNYFRRLLPAERGARFLDLGCGYGSFLWYLRGEGYQNACGVDVSAEQVEAARRLGLDNVFLGDAGEFLEAHPAAFDCVTAFDLLEHLTKDEVLAILDAIRHALKPGGLLLLRAPNADGPFGGKIRYSDFTHEQAFTPSSIRQILAATGFVRCQVLPEGPRVHGAVSAVRWAAWKILSFLLLLCLGAETGRLRGHVLTQNLIATVNTPNPAGDGTAKA